MLKLICAQSGRSLGRERKTDPASNARSNTKGLKDNNNRLLGIFNKFCVPFDTEIRISICRTLDSDCTVVTLHRVANFRARHLNSYVELAREGYNINSITVFTACINTPISFFSRTDRKQAVF